MTVLKNKKILISEGLDLTLLKDFFLNLDITVESASSFKESDFTETWDQAFFQGRKEGAFFTTKHLENATLKDLIEHSIRKQESVDFIDKFCGDKDICHSFKVHDYGNIGYIVDGAVSDLYENGYSAKKVRRLLNTFIEKGMEISTLSDELVDISLDYVFSNDGVCFQLAFKANAFEHFDNFDSFYSDLKSHTNFLDITFVEKTKRLILSSYMLKKDQTQEQAICFYRHLKALKLDENSKEQGELKVLSSDFENKRFDGKDYDPVALLKQKNLKKYLNFVKNVLEKKQKSFSEFNFTEENIAEFLETYPVGSGGNKDNKEFQQAFFDLVKSEQKNENSALVKVKDVDSRFVSEKFEEIKQVLCERTIDDLDEAIKVTGKVNNEESSQLGVINTQDKISSNEVWEVKRLEIKNKLDEVAKGNGLLNMDAIVSIVAESLDAPKEKIEPFLENILNESFSLRNELVTKKSTPVEKSSTDENEIFRLKKILVTLKKQLLNVQNTNKILQEQLSTSSTSSALRMLELPTGESNALEVSRLKEYFEGHLNQKEEERLDLVKKIEDLKAEQATEIGQALDELNKKHDDEVKGLKNKLALAMKRIETLNENHVKLGENQVEVHKNEINTLSDKISLAQTVVGKLKEENETMISHHLLEVDALRAEIALLKAQSLEGKVSTQKTEEANATATQLQNLLAERKILEEKFRAQGMELKKAEQQIKYMHSVIESGNRKKNQGNKGADLAVKQLEKASAQLNKVNSELADKKKENLRLKQDQGKSNSRILELERKLAILEKNAA